MKKLITVLAASMAITGLASAQTKFVESVTRKGSGVVIPYQKYVLVNGLKVILTEDHSDPLVHVDVTYHVGSAREEIGKSGFAHFFEHMMFQGSDNVADEQHFKLISESGGTLNGSTNQDRTNYYETVPNNQLEKMLWLESDRMGFLLDAVTQRKFEVQRSTVKNERGQNYDNRPYGLVNQVASKNLYPYGHPYSWLTIGYLEDLDRVNVQDLKNFFLRWYGPNNATITIGGDINPAATLKMVEKYFGSIPRGPEVTPTLLAPVVINADRYVSFTDNYARIPMLTKTYVTVPNYNDDIAPLACLAQILGQGKNSILYQQMVKPQKALNASANSRLSELSGEFTFSMMPYPGNTLLSLDSMLAASLQVFETRGVTDEDILKFKGGIESQYVNALQSVSGKVSQLAAFETYTGNPNQIGNILQKYLAVTKADVQRVYEKYIKNKYSVTVSVLTKDSKIIAAKPDNYKIDTTGYIQPNYGYNGLKYVKAKDNFNRKLSPAAGANPVVKVPVFWKKSLANGVRMIGNKNDELPVVTVNIKIPGGHLTAAGDSLKLGLSGLTANMLNEDTKNYTAEDMAVALQKLGSNISVLGVEDGTVFSVQTLSKNLQPTMVLLQERLLNPKFTEEALNRLKKQQLEGFKQRKSQPAAIASDVMDRLNYGSENILGLSANGTERSIQNISLADVQKYYTTYFTTRGTNVVVVGNVAETEIVPLLSFLNNMPNKVVDVPMPKAAPVVTKTTVYLVDVPNAAQTEFRVGNASDLRYDAFGDYYKATLMNYILGGDFNSHLNINLREDKGWTYGARSNVSANKYSGNFMFSSGIRADATDSALVEVMKELDAYYANGITNDDLKFMKSALGQRDARSYETGAQKAGFLSRILEYNLPPNFTDRQNQILQGLTKKDVDASAKLNINTAKMNILLVGDKARILPGIQKLGYDVVELTTEGTRK